MFSKIFLSLTSLLVAAAALAPFVAAEQTGGLKQFAYSKTESLTTQKEQTSDDKVFYLAPGKSYCNVTYRDESEVACVKDYWLDPKQQNACQRFVKITNHATGITARAQLLDKCGDVKNSTFGINDIYVSLRTFRELSGAKDYAKNKDIGNLQSQVTWDFIPETCQGCASGIVGRDEHGRIDQCDGKDDLGFARCGRKKGTERALTLRQVEKECSSSYVCPDAKATPSGSTST